MIAITYVFAGPCKEQPHFRHRRSGRWAPRNRPLFHPEVTVRQVDLVAVSAPEICDDVGFRQISGIVIVDLK